MSGILLMLFVFACLFAARYIVTRNTRIPAPQQPGQRLDRYADALVFAPDYDPLEHDRRVIAGIALKKKLAVRERRDAIRARRQAEPTAAAPTNVTPMPKRRRA